MKFNNLTQSSQPKVKEEKGFIKIKDLLHECYENEHKLPSNHKKIAGYLSISQIAGNKACMRREYYNVMQHEFDNKFDFNTHSILKIGSLYHDMVQTVLLKYNKIEYVEHFLWNDEYKICGSIDGIIKDKDGSYILNDFKTISSTGFDYILKSGKAKEEHISQVHLYRFMIERQLGIKIDKMKITYLHKNQNHYGLRLDSAIKQLESTLEYLNGVYDWLSNNNRSTDKIAEQINNIRYSIDSIKFNTEKYEDEDYHIKEIDFMFDQDVLNKELRKIKEFWELIESNKIIAENNKTATRKADIKKEKFPNKISVNYICNSCRFLQVCRDGVKLK